MSFKILAYCDGVPFKFKTVSFCFPARLEWKNITKFRVAVCTQPEQKDHLSNPMFSGH